MDLSDYARLIGMEVRERYGRFRGRIVGLDMTPNGEVKGIVYENDGVILSRGVEAFRVREGYVEVGPPSIFKAEDCMSKLNLLKLQFEALYSGSGDGQGPMDSRALTDEVERAYNEVKAMVETCIRSLEARRERLEERKRWLLRLLLSMDVVKKLGMVDERGYLEAYEALETELFRVYREIEDTSIFVAELSAKLEDIEAIKSGAREAEEIPEIGFPEIKVDGHNLAKEIIEKISVPVQAEGEAAE